MPQGFPVDLTNAVQIACSCGGKRDCRFYVSESRVIYFITPEISRERSESA